MRVDYASSMDDFMGQLLGSSGDGLFFCLIAVAVNCMDLTPTATLSNSTFHIEFELPIAECLYVHDDYATLGNPDGWTGKGCYILPLNTNASSWTDVYSHIPGWGVNQLKLSTQAITKCRLRLDGPVSK